MQKAKPLKTLRVLLTAGPTRAYLDRVRFLSNFSTGELGFLTAKELQKKGVKIFAVVGPCHPPFEDLKLEKLIRVETNEQMEAAVFKILKTQSIDWGIFSSAVLDFKPRRVGTGKTSSHRGGWKIDLVPTHKIIDRVSKRFPNLKKVGFKLEWKVLNEKARQSFAARQIKKRQYDAMVLNFLPEVKTAAAHKAYLFQGTKVEVATSKPAIARWISKIIRYRISDI